MIDLTFDPVTGVAKLVAPAIVKRTADVPVRVTFAPAPGEVSGLQLALITADADASVLAYTEDFASEGARVWTATLDANDTRLATFLTGKASAPVNVELIAIIDGARVIAPNLGITAQSTGVTGPETTEGGPRYYTQEEVDDLLAALGGGAATWGAIGGFLRGLEFVERLALLGEIGADHGGGAEQGEGDEEVCFHDVAWFE